MFDGAPGVGAISNGTAAALFAERLARESSRIARALAEVLDLIPSGLDASGDDAAAFLGSFRFEDEDAHGRPIAPVHPLDRLSDALGLSQHEIDLLLLAGLPDAHEGFS